jgi:hypothetical protein
MAKGNGIVIAVVALVLFWIIFKPKFRSSYNVFSDPLSSGNGGNSAQTGLFQSSTTNQGSMGWVPSSMGVSSSLLPKEIPSQEDFGDFSADAILSGQSYLDPRAQIGFPETTGGVLRNANWDVRSEPVNPRVPVSIWQNSTIVPDLMRPQFEIGR